MEKVEKLKMFTLITKFFAITSYVMTWYAAASDDAVIDRNELVSLGGGICDILGLKTEIVLPVDPDKKHGTW